MFRKVYVSKLQLESQQFAVKSSQLNLDSANITKEVLEKYTRAKMLEDLGAKNCGSRDQVFIREKKLTIWKCQSLSGWKRNLRTARFSPRRAAWWCMPTTRDVVVSGAARGRKSRKVRRCENGKPF